MRLTLRTLLAYLDDVLEPAEAKEIGKKIQESPLATSLIGRIREVMRRRRLGAADLEGPGIGIDPNLVAQYLDNTLPTEKVAEIEKICLESDQHLAEVAACHQILSIALGEPVEISPSQRERLYVLGPVEANAKLQTGAQPSLRNGSVTAKTPVSIKTVPGSAGPSFEETLPEYLRPKPQIGTFLTIAAGIVLIAIWLAALYSEQTVWNRLVSLRPSTTPSVSEPAAPEQDEEIPPGAAANAAPGDDASDKSLAVKDPKAIPPAVEYPVDRPIEPLVAPEEPPVDAISDLAALDPGVPPETVPVPAPQPVVPKALAPVTVNYISVDGVLLTHLAQDEDWYVVPRETALRPGAVLACPEPFESTLEFDRGALQLTLLGDSVIELLPPDDVSPIGVRLIRGRVVIHVSRRDDVMWPLHYQVGPQHGLLEFPRIEMVCGLEFQPALPLGFERPAPITMRPEGLYTVTGVLKWRPRDGQEVVVNNGQMVTQLAGNPPVSYGNLPEWLDPQGRKKSVLRRHAKAFEEEFELNEPIDSSLWSLVRDDPRPRISELAIRSLALCENHKLLVKGLTQTSQEDVRKAAISGLRSWLGSDQSHGELLIKSLREFYEREEDVEILYRLLWGISAQEAQSPQVSIELVDWLRSDKLEIRELAAANLLRLTDRTLGYQPLAAEPQRRAAVKRWNDLLERDGTLVKVPEPTAPDDPDAVEK